MQISHLSEYLLHRYKLLHTLYRGITIHAQPFLTNYFLYKINRRRWLIKNFKKIKLEDTHFLTIEVLYVLLNI